VVQGEQGFLGEEAKPETVTMEQVAVAHKFIKVLPYYFPYQVVLEGEEVI
jgi:hypothetical protein